MSEDRQFLRDLHYMIWVCRRISIPSATFVKSTHSTLWTFAHCGIPIRIRIGTGSPSLCVWVEFTLCCHAHPALLCAVTRTRPVTSCHPPPNGKRGLTGLGSACHVLPSRLQPPISDKTQRDVISLFYILSPAGHLSLEYMD